MSESSPTVEGSDSRAVIAGFRWALEARDEAALERVIRLEATRWFPLHRVAELPTVDEASSSTGHLGTSSSLWTTWPRTHRKGPEVAITSMTSQADG